MAAQALKEPARIFFSVREMWPTRLNRWRWRIPVGVAFAWQQVYIAVGRGSDWWPWKALSLYAYSLFALLALLEGRDWCRRRQTGSPESLGVV